MFDQRELQQLAERKRLLIDLIELRRELFVADATRLEASFSWAPAALARARSLFPLLLAFSPLAGFFLGRKTTRLTRIIGTVFSGFSLAKQGLRAWRTFRAARS